MSTRSRAKPGVESKSTSNVRLKSRGNAQHDDMDVDGTGKENNISRGSAKPAKKQRKTAKGKDSVHSRKSIDCICSKGDDGSPMILCSECKIWYHFTCVDISEPEAEEISVYICPTCTVSTGRSSTMTWEGEQANEECSDDENAITEKRKAALGTRKVSPVPLPTPEGSEESSSSEDEYVDVKPEHVEDNKITDKQRTQRRSKSVTSNSESVDDTRRRRLSRVRVASPPPQNLPTTLKRKAAVSSVVRTSPAPKRKRSADSGNSATDDPARKYCLGKLEELFKDVFLRYPNARANVKRESEENKMNVDEDQKEIKPDPVDTQEAKLGEEQKQALTDAANQFAKELESCVFEIYSEPDKNGNPHAGGKYKERFRMLQFNLSKADRVVIHQRITSGNITAKEISLMSSTDLADEETKQSIKQAEQEALEYSILQRSTAPRAKITHKGLQDIESVNGDVPSALEVERHKEREVEEEERREKERMARLRTVQRQRTMSLSIPPESPSVPQAADQQWGAPPPVPAHAMSPTLGDNEEMVNKPSSTTQGPQDSGSMEPELNLADFLNMDDEQEPSGTPIDQQTGSHADSIANSLNTSAPQQSNTTSTPTGISPFAARPRTASFDLNALWNAPKEDPQAATNPSAQTEPQTELTSSSEAPVDNPTEDSDKDDAMELESVEANDQDFDMFLDEDKVDSPTDLIVTPLHMEEVENLPQVWSGKIAMPLDSSVPQETNLVARQIAGKALPPDSPLWKTLFPTEQLRIEGRVPVENSVKYLMAMRLNPTKELYGAAFTASSATNIEDFKTFCNFLVSKNRHGLVFPWGSRPKDYHPGRELYMVPLLQTQALPEFVELLDNLKIPSTRTKDYLLGIWVLNKGKLAPLPGATQPIIAPPVAPQQSASFPPTNASAPPFQNTMFNAPPPPPTLLPHNIPPVAAALAQLPGAPPIAPAALAAEVASLTPEQLQEVLRTLAATTNQIPLPLPNLMPPIVEHPPPPPPALPPFNQSRPPFPPHGPTPPIASHTPPVPPNVQPWIQHMPAPSGYPTNYPPSSVPYQQPSPRGSIPPQIPYERHENERDFRGGPHYSQGPRNDYEDRSRRNNSHNNNNRGNTRGRGGRNNDGHDREFRRNSDSGWPRRQRNDSGGPGW